MRFGLTTDFRNPPDSGKSSAQVYAGIIDAMVFAESLGFDGRTFSSIISPMMTTFHPR
jgi:hypothetical protein